MHKEVSLFWHRRDIRLQDNAGLFNALNTGLNVQPIFIFDKSILQKLPANDLRVNFIYNEISKLKKMYNDLGSDLLVFFDFPSDVFKQLFQNTDWKIKHVFTNEDVEPYAISRDNQIKEICAVNNAQFTAVKDQVIFGANEVLKDDKKPYTVFTPYAKKWRSLLTSNHFKSFDTMALKKHFIQTSPSKLLMLSEMGFIETDFEFPSLEVSTDLIKNYTEKRNFPAINGTSKLGIHIRFGTVSIRTLLRNYLSVNDTWISELIWRDFYSQILAHFPHVAQQSFKPAYDHIPWRNNEQEFERWKSGNTGIPIVDAGMRELAQTGFMHNRVRMIVASYLCKNLLIDWRWGEAWFAEKLLDFDLASNNGGWQWAAGSGVDAAPYFRIFNPDLQTKKFDPQLVYCKKWVPEMSSLNYMGNTVVAHDFARNRCLEVYKKALNPIV